MQLADVVEVIEANSVRTANALLGQGWTLIAVSTWIAHNGTQSPCYVLGKKKLAAEPEPRQSTPEQEQALERAAATLADVE